MRRSVIFASLLLSFASAVFAQERPTHSTTPFEGREIRASERDDFDRWIDESLAIYIRQRKGLPKEETTTAAGQKAEPAKDAKKPAKGKYPPGTVDDLMRTHIDIRSFEVIGKKNQEFPWMLYTTEFKELPLYYANPVNVYRQVTKKFPPATNGGAPELNICHSSFFTNTEIESYSPEFLCAENRDLQPVPPMEITKVKKDRTSEGIWIKDARGKKYILLFDSPFCPEMTTSAELIGSTLARIVGYQVPKICVTTVQGTGNPKYDGRRVVATVALSNFRGGWRHGSFRNRREIRGLQLLGAWVGNVDQTEQNSGYTADDNGVVRHYTIDFGAALGSFTFRPQIARLGWTKLFDPYQQFTQPLYDRGIRKVPWEAPYAVHSPAIGYFNDNVDPDRWQPFYQNMGFIEVNEEDRVWLAHRIARISDQQIHTIVSLANFSRPEDADHIATTLIKRRDIIATHYLRCK